MHTLSRQPSDLRQQIFYIQMHAAVKASGLGIEIGTRMQIRQKRAERCGIARINHIPAAEAQHIAEAAAGQRLRVFDRHRRDKPVRAQRVGRQHGICIRAASVEPLDQIPQIVRDFLCRCNDRHRDMQHMLCKVNQHRDSADVVAVRMRHQHSDAVKALLHIPQPVECRHRAVQQNQSAVRLKKRTVLRIRKR